MIDLQIDQKPHTAVYLFGSAIYSEQPNDIDLAIIYDKKNISVEEALNFRVELIKDLEEKLNCPIDVILLSVEEEDETDFLLNAKHKLIYKNY